MRSSNQPSHLKPLLIIPFFPLLVLHPLLVHGISCGQDLSFHIQSWLDAATQLSHWQYPHWAFSPAWNAGEPRFLFYPPLSWLLGAGLISIFSPSAAPIAYIYLCLCAAGFAMHHLARHYVSPNAALLAAAFYLANPYLLFCAFERTAFAELLAAAWIPLLLLAVLRERPTVRSIAIPIALLWLTNAPAAVMGCYTFALFATLRVALSLMPQQPATSATIGYPEASASGLISPAEERGFSPGGMHSLRLAATYIAGTLLGLALPAYYLIPAAYERRYVQIAMAIIPSLRVQNNFLFTRTADAAHNAVNHTASSLALTLLLLTLATLIALFALRRNTTWHLIYLAITTLAIALLLTPISLQLWLHLPNLQYLQFPWRLLTILSAILAFALALLLDTTPFIPTRHALSSILYSLSPVFLCLALTVIGYRLYAQVCDQPDRPTTIAALYNTHHGAPPTDEYTPTAADNDVLRTDNPGYWLASTRNAPASNTTPTATELNPSIDTDDTPIPEAQTLSTPAPTHLVLHLSHPQTLILNLRDYPSWRIVRNGLMLDARLQRDDGLLAVALPAGASTLDIRWHDTPDQTLGLILSLCAMLLLVVSAFSKNSV
ncbi:hypothetical protein GOB94_04925 [Granulicella sp. 5B5]|uniref:hypothetical protein n=1 Tax=Granulicella sp. 5B5 TaxID=1617967 RepID=UPI0015F557D2|nr:hypothetical protein [Granulicella sp. 5B5]QMV18108.1 hypothetical protein GOB94_04925 [Granulicella sp. 5B5]